MHAFAAQERKPDPNLTRRKSFICNDAGARGRIGGKGRQGISRFEIEKTSRKGPEKGRPGVKSSLIPSFIYLETVGEGAALKEKCKLASSQPTGWLS